MKDCEDILLSFFNSLPQIAFLLAPDGKIKQINDKGREWLAKIGLPVKENGETKYYPDFLKDAGCDAERIKVIEEKIKSLFDGEKEDFEEEISLEDDENKLWQKINASKYEEHVIILAEDITERERQRQKFEEIFNNITDVVWALSWPEMEFDYITPSAEDVYGYSPESFEENPSLWQEVTHPDDRHLNDKALEKIREKGESQRECRIIRKDGSTGWVRDRSKLIYDEENNPVKLMGIATDITERKEMEKELNLTQFSVDNAAIGIFQVTPEGKFEYANDKACEMLNYSQEELIGMSVSDINAYPDERENVWNEIKRGEYKTEKLLQTKDGRNFPAQIKSNYVKYGEEEYEFAFVQDITERKEKEKQIERLLEEYETIFNNVQAPIFLLDVEEKNEIKFQRFNPREEEITGLKTEEVKDKTPEEVLGEELGKEVAENYRKCLREEEKIEYEEKLELPTGEKISITNLAPVEIDGKVEKIVGTVRDITKERREKLKSDALFENSTSAIAILDDEGNIVDINDEFQEVFGYNLPEVKGEHLDNVMEWGKEGYADREATEEFLQGKKIKGKGTRYDKRGNPKEFLFHGIPIIVDEKVEGAYVLYDDITELKREKEKLEAIFEASQDVAFVLTGAEKDIEVDLIKEFSPGAENLFGYAKEEVIDEPVSILHPGEDMEKIPEIDQHLARGERWEDKVEAIRKNGEKFPALFTVYPFRSKVGNNRDLAVFIEITELEEARKELEDTKNELEAILESIQDGISVLNPDLTVRYANNTMVEWYEENVPLEGKKCYQVYQNRDEPCTDCPTLRSFKSGEVERKIVTGLEGSEVEYLELFSYPMKEKDTGEVTGVVEFVRDITERKKAEKELEMTKFFLDNSDMMVFRVTPEGKILYANEKASGKLGYSRKEIQNMNVGRVIPDEDFVEREKFWQQIKQNNSLSYEKKFITAEGELFPVSIVSQHFQYEDEEYELVFVRDITERKEIEKELRIREEQYRKIFETAPVGIILEDKEGNILEVNDKFCEMKGFDEEELVGRNILETVVPHELKEKTKKNIERILAGENLELEIYSRRKTGKRYYAQMHETKVRLPEGEEGILSIQMDITEKKEKEEKLKRINQKLNREYERAEVLHNNMLPSELPQIEKLEMDAYYNPSYRLGGDFYDFYDYRESKKQIIFYISDISGHDISSSMVNIFLKDAINSYFKEANYVAEYGERLNVSPAEIVKFIEDKFKNLDIPDDYFISLLVGTIDTQNNIIRICNAGIHSPPLLLKNDEIIQLENTGFPITSLEEVNFEYKETAINLKPGETFFACTDGLIEQEIEGNREVKNREKFGEERLIEVLEKNRDNSPAEIIAAVNNRLEKLKGDIETQDDLTYIAIQHK